jgi:hypothetical protein
MIMKHQTEDAPPPDYRTPAGESAPAAGRCRPLRPSAVQAASPYDALHGGVSGGERC